MTGGGSLRRRLMAVLAAGVLGAWVATAFFTYIDTRRAVDAMLDASAIGAERLRSELAESVAAHLMHPLIIAVPLLGVVIWLAVGWGLAPLRALADQVQRRDPRDLTPLRVPAPEEAQPLQIALNGLFGRLDAMFERERRFTADAAHELRTPLAAIRTHAQVALAAVGDEQRREALQGVVEGAVRATHLVEQLLVLARIDAAPAMEPVCLADLAAEAVAEMAGAAQRKGVDLGLAGADGGVVDGNAALLGILVRNLADNAVRYVPSGGRIDVAVRRTPAGMELSVADDGPGIPVDQRMRAFERFHRGLGTGAEGSGLGLSIVARIAEQHGATVTLGDGLGGRGLGATVLFALRSA